MMGREIEGVVRPLGAFERMYHRRQQKSTQHSCMVAELAEDIDPFTLAELPRNIGLREHNDFRRKCGLAVG